MGARSCCPRLHHDAHQGCLLSVDLDQGWTRSEGGRHGKDEQKIGTVSQVGTGGFAYQDGAASSRRRRRLQPSGPVASAGFFFGRVS
jgi:hypothetical protein